MSDMLEYHFIYYKLNKSEHIKRNFSGVVKHV
jgi:hypothetical protein